MQKYNVFIARFPYGGSEAYAVADWLVKTVIAMKSDSRIGEVQHKTYDDTPITMSRNRAVLDARANKADYLLMIDSDMVPDVPTPGSRPFWISTFDFLLETRDKGPSVVAAPYCGPPPHENVYAFRWANWQNDEPEKTFFLDAFTRHEAAQLAGIQSAGALATGLIVYDIRAFEKLPHPWFDYEYTDETCAYKSSTEDCFNTRNLGLIGIPLYVNWDAWAGHIKRKVVGKPNPMRIDDIRKEFADVIRKDLKVNEVVIEVGKRPIGRAFTIKDGIIINGKPKDVKVEHAAPVRTGTAMTASVATPPPEIIPAAPKDIHDFAWAWKDSEGFHRFASGVFERELENNEPLIRYRKWIEDKRWGFSDRSSYHLFKILVAEMPPIFSFLEIGVHRGQSVVLMGILASLSKKKAKIVGVSTFDGREVSQHDPHYEEDEDYADSVMNTWNKWVGSEESVLLLPIVGDSTGIETIRSAASNGLYHIVFIDGGHRYETASSDIINYAPLVEPGGYLLIDDCANDLKLPDGQFPGFKSVTDAAKAHLPMSGHSLKWTHIGNVGHIRIWQKRTITNNPRLTTEVRLDINSPIVDFPACHLPHCKIQGPHMHYTPVEATPHELVSE